MNDLEDPNNPYSPISMMHRTQVEPQYQGADARASCSAIAAIVIFLAVAFIAMKALTSLGLTETWAVMASSVAAFTCVMLAIRSGKD